jgi:hypothetical protein
LNLKRHLGLVLIVVSFLPWAAIPLIVPILSLSLQNKALLVPILAVVAEVTFWLGLLLVGKEAAQRYRRYLNFRYLRQQLKKFWQ